MGHCGLLAHPDLCGKSIGVEGSERIAEVLGQCGLLAHLNPGGNPIGAEEVGRVAEMLGQLQVTCSSESWEKLDWS